MENTSRFKPLLDCDTGRTIPQRGRPYAATSWMDGESRGPKRRHDTFGSPDRIGANVLTKTEEVGDHGYALSFPRQMLMKDEPSPPRFSPYMPQEQKGQETRLSWLYSGQHGSSTPPEKSLALAEMPPNHNPPNSETLGMNPNCAICNAPASEACLCESRAFELAITQSELRMMRQRYEEIR
jgi:hypothetical protein